MHGIEPFQAFGLGRARDALLLARLGVRQIVAGGRELNVLGWIDFSEGLQWAQTVYCHHQDDTRAEQPSYMYMTTCTCTEGTVVLRSAEKLLARSIK